MQQSDQEETDISNNFQSRARITSKGALEFCRSANSGWLLVIAGSAFFIAAGFLIARAYQAGNRTRTEKFLQELQSWIENNRASVPSSLRKRIDATTSFLGSLQQKRPIEKLIGHFRPKSFWSIFS
jgi:hypothetical protein